MRSQFLLYSVRRQLRATQAEMGKLLGISRLDYRALENGKIDLTKDHIVSLCSSLNIHTSRFEFLIEFLKEHELTDQEIQPSSHKHYGILLPLKFFTIYLELINQTFKRNSHV